MNIGMIETVSPLGLEEAAALLADYFCDIVGCWQEDCSDETATVAYLWNTDEWMDAMLDAGMDGHVHAVYGDAGNIGGIWQQVDAVIDVDGELWADNLYGMPGEPLALGTFQIEPTNIYVLFAYATD